jgi:uroporphyrinogen-III synthase
MQVVVTRPLDQAVAWTEGLATAGHTPHSLPLIDIAALTDTAPVQAAWRHLASYQAVMFVSSSAVGHFISSSMASSQSEHGQIAITMRAWATGPGTVQALLGAGWPAMQIDAPATGQFDSEALWLQVRHQVPPGGRVLMVRATGGGRDWLTRQLEADGVAVEHCAAYRRQVPVWTAAQAEQARSLAGPHAVWLLSSSEGIGNLASLLPGQDWSKARAIATHPRIAGTARALGFAVVAPSRPTLAEVLASIESLA